MESLLLNNEKLQYPTNIGNCDDGTFDSHEPDEGLTLRLKNVRPRSENDEEEEDEADRDEDDHMHAEDDRPVKRLKFMMSDQNLAESLQEQEKEDEDEDGGGDDGGEEDKKASSEDSSKNNTFRLVMSRQSGDNGGRRYRSSPPDNTVQLPQSRSRRNSTTKPEQVTASIRPSRGVPQGTVKTDRSTVTRTSGRASTRARALNADHSESEEEEDDKEEEAVNYGVQEGKDDDGDEDDNKPLVVDNQDSVSEESYDSVPRASRRKVKAKVPKRSCPRVQGIVKPMLSRRSSSRSRVSYAEADSEEDDEDSEDNERIEMEDYNKNSRSESDDEDNDDISHTAIRRSGRESSGKNKFYDVKVDQRPTVTVKKETRGHVAATIVPPLPPPALPTRSRVPINSDNSRQRRLPTSRSSSSAAPSSSSYTSSSSSASYPVASPVMKPPQNYRIDSDTKANMNLILTTIETADKQNLFAESVTDEEAPGYSEIILHPMDLGTARYVRFQIVFLRAEEQRR